MKPILRFIGSLLIGACIGLLLVVPIISLLEGESLSAAFGKIFSLDFLPVLDKIGLALLALIICFYLQVIIHEGGHLVAGLLTGYKFVSFRVLNWTLIRQNGRLHWRNYELAGTGGQCLLAPPDRPIDQIDTRWYNAGGVVANALVSLVAIVLVWTCDLPEWLDIFLGMMAFIGILLVLTNGIPMKVGGVANDGSNLFQMEKDVPAKKCFCDILEVNACSQEGVPYNEMPERLFELPQPIDWTNSMHVGAVQIAVTRMLERHQWEEAYRSETEALSHKEDYMELYQVEMENLMTQVCILTGRDEEARQHYNGKVSKHVTRHAPTQADKQFTMMAVALALNGDRARAEEIYHKLEAERDKYIHQTDVALSLDLMRWLLDNRTAQV